MRFYTDLSLVLLLLVLASSGHASLKRFGRLQGALEAGVVKSDDFPNIYERLGSPTLNMALAIDLIEKVEAAYGLDVVQTTDALRRLAGYDSNLFQRLLGTSAATDLTPKNGLTQDDINTLRLMVSHDVVNGREFGVVTFGQPEIKIALGHVICGFSAGHHRLTSVTMSWVNNIGVGSSLDNLYAITLAGDIGQTACFKNAGKQSAYIGPGTEATFAEVYGDIDGYLIGDGVSSFSGKKLSEVLKTYYNNPSFSISASKRIDLLGLKDGTKMLDESIKFASNYKYTVFNKLKAPFLSMDSDVIKAYDAVRLWAADRDPLTLAQVQTMLTRSGDVYSHRANGATEIYYQYDSASSTWQWSLDKSTWQSTKEEAKWKGTLPGNARAGDVVPVLNNIRLIYFLKGHTQSTI